jgi:NAD(P)-dependent dehydrogenase (short-subunit alcohol dehydrogenase family)
MTWVRDDIPDQTGRTALVTGVTVGGIGFETALELARRGARVLLAGRTPARLEESAAAIRAEAADAELDLCRIDLADLGSVREGAVHAAALVGGQGLQLLVNNAGVMAPPYRRTADGLELQMATNHFGPFLLAGLLLPTLAARGGAQPSRIVTVASLAHGYARHAPLGDPHAADRRYLRWQVYGETKLANLLFTFEADRRLAAAGLPVAALAAHPGLTGTHLVVNGQLGGSSGRRASILDAAVRAVTQSPADGALPILMAATAELPGGTYCGPGGRRQWRGSPRLVGTDRSALDVDAQRRLWEISEQTVGLRWP